MNVGFKDARYGSISISSYPTGQIGFLLCRKSPEASPSIEQVSMRFQKLVQMGKETSYFQPKLQESAFSLPLWVERRIYQSSEVADADAVVVVNWKANKK